jgi:hypothetical protein
MRAPAQPPSSSAVLAHGYICSPARYRNGLDIPGPSGPQWECGIDCPAHGLEVSGKLLAAEDMVVSRRRDDEDKPTTEVSGG